MILLRLGAALLVASLLNITLEVRAADFDNYLLDDTDGVLTVNVKQVGALPAYSKYLEKLGEKILGPAMPLLRDSRVDSVKDIERVTVVMGRSLSPVQGEVKEGTPMISGTVYVIVQGNLDAAMLKALAQRAAKEPRLKVTEQKIGDLPVWQVIGDHPLYVAMPEKGTVIISGIKGHVADALAKGTGKMKTRLKSKAMEDLLAKLDPKASASWAATNDMIYAWSAGGTGGTVKVMHHTLGDDGITAATGSLTVADDLQGTIILVCENADKTGSIQDFWKQQLAMVENHLDEEARQDAKKKQELAPLVTLLKGIKITSKDRTITTKVQGSAEVIEILLRLR